MNCTSCFWEKNWVPSSVDFLIIGAGIVGLSAAIELREKHPNANIVILEKLGLGAGASSRNAGFACFGSPTELLADLKTMEQHEVEELLQMRWQGLKLLEERIGSSTLDLKKWGGYECFFPSEKETFVRVNDHLSMLNKIVFSATGLAQTFQTTSLAPFGMQFLPEGIKNVHEGQLDTGKMYRALNALTEKKNIRVLRGLEVHRFEESTSGVTVFLEDQLPHIHARHLLVCSNGFSQKFFPHSDIQPARAQVIVTAPISGLPLQGTFHVKEGFYYFRNIGNRILLGGGRELDFQKETTDKRALNPLISNRLKELLHTYIAPDVAAEIEYQWSGTMGVGKTKFPWVEQVSPHITVGIRLGGMGVAIGSFLGQKIAKLVTQCLCT